MRLYGSLVRRLYQVNLFSPAQLRLGTILRLHEALGAPRMRFQQSMPRARMERDAIHEAAVSGEGGEASEKDLVLVCGSLYMMADARQELGFEESQENLERLGTDDWRDQRKGANPPERLGAV